MIYNREFQPTETFRCRGPFGPRSRRFAPFTREGKVKWYSLAESFVEINAGARYRVAVSSKGLPFRRAPVQVILLPRPRSCHLCIYVCILCAMHICMIRVHTRKRRARPHSMCVWSPIPVNDGGLQIAKLLSKSREGKDGKQKKERERERERKREDRVQRNGGGTRWQDEGSRKKGLEFL